jgi:hypothetical protein
LLLTTSKENAEKIGHLHQSTLGKHETIALKVIAEKNSSGKTYFQQTVIEMEMQQIAESIEKISKRVLARRQNTPQLSQIFKEAKQNRPAILSLKP